MSNALILKNGLLAVTCIAGLTLTACASGQNGSSRYGSVYDYESGGNACQAGPCGPAVAAPVYGGQQVIGGQTVSPGVVYTDCSAVSGMNCNPQPAQTYTQPTPAYTPPATTYGNPVACPSGTTPNGDGSCMETGGGYDYSTTTVTTPSYSSGERVPCPSGTTAAGDGSCMQSGSTYDFSSTTTSTYTGSSGYTGEAMPCPAGTTPNGDGTCMEGAGVTIYNNTNTGYVPPATYTPPITYLPIRK